MKYTPKLVLLLIAIAFITACSKSNLDNEILGTWYLNTDTVTYSINGVENQQDIYPNFNRHIYYQYNKDGSGFYRTDTIPGAINFHYTLSGNNLSLRFPAEVYNNLSYQADTTACTILLLTHSSLDLTYSFNKGAYIEKHSQHFGR